MAVADVPAPARAAITALECEVVEVAVLERLQKVDAWAKRIARDHTFSAEVEHEAIALGIMPPDGYRVADTEA